MTRVNVLSPNVLCDSHLLAEIREITRIPNTIVSGKAVLTGDYSNEYILGKGHVKMFYNKLKWLRNRHLSLLCEAKKRSFNVVDRWPTSVPERLFNDWIPSQNAYKINAERILDRIPKKPKYYGKDITVDWFLEKVNANI